jgi:hypothetical protein
MHGIKTFFGLYFLGSIFLYAQVSDSNKPVSSINEPMTFLDADFFADSLSEAYTLEEDPMGAQRLLQVRNSSLSPSVILTSNYNYTSNSEKVATNEKEGTTFNLSLTFNLGLGEYGIGDEVVCAPALSFVQMRTFTDPFRDYGDNMKVYDLDTQIASLSLPFVLPNDFSLTVSNAYVVPSTFRGKKNIISYSNTPSVSFAKNFILNSGDVINFTASTSYTFTQGDTLEETIADPVYFNFIEAVMQQSGISPSSDYPSNLQDGLGHALSLSYTKQLSDNLTIVPAWSYQSNSFTEGSNKSRVDRVYNAGLSASCAFTEWLSVSGLANYSWKRTNDDLNVPEFEDFIGGLSINLNHSF